MTDENDNFIPNKQILKSLDVEYHYDSLDEIDSEEDTIDEDDLPPVIDNTDLPDMDDLDYKTVEAEKQLEEIISMGLSLSKNSIDVLNEVEPRFKGRHMEVISNIMSTTFNAVKH